MSVPKEKGEMGSKDEMILAQQLKMQFHGTRKGDLETIEAYVKILKSTSDSLAAIGNPVSDPDLVLQLLAGLPCQYLLLKNTISSRFPLPNFSEACSMLYEYEKLLLGQEKTSTPPPPPPPHGVNRSASSGAVAENNDSSKTTVEMIHDIASTVTAVASIARDFWKAVGWSGYSGTAAAAAAAPPNKNYKKRPGGRGNYKRGGGPSTTNSGRK